MIKCPFCKYTSDECNVCSGFGWFIPDDPADSLSDDICERTTEIVPNYVSLEQAIKQNPIHALSILTEWFDNTSKDLANITGSYVFYRDVADLLIECKGYLQQLESYERAISGEDELNCLVTMWASQQY